ncbi:hypothetical protein [Nitrosomonas sp.]|uniref:hypothetical protein n=1 Tax=Nitrosomonas sp. TaxID=42353 RepID=UPI0037C5EA86
MTMHSAVGMRRNELLPQSVAPYHPDVVPIGKNESIIGSQQERYLEAIRNG